MKEPPFVGFRDTSAADVVLVDRHFHLEITGIRGEKLPGCRLSGGLRAASVAHDIDPGNRKSVA